MSTWGREKFTSGWNNPGHFQYDSADLPFSGEAGYLESGFPLWKISSITEMEKSFCAGPDSTSSGKDQPVSPLMKISSARSQENVSHVGVADGGESSQPRHWTAEEKRRMSQSLPATPLVTPAQTPCTTPAPTPQSSPSLPRKTEMDAVRKTSAWCNQQFATEQQTTQNIKWFYMSFLPQPANTSRAMEPSSDQPKQVAVRKDSVVAVAEQAGNLEAAKKDPTTSTKETMPRPYLRRCAPLMSNRDMNFLAPTSM